MRKRRGATALALMLAACGGRGQAPPSATAPVPTIAPSTTPTGVIGARVWLAVFRTANDPFDLNADTRTLLARVDGAIRVSPVLCFDGLPAAMAPTDYLMGVAAPTKGELQRLIARSGFRALLEVRVTELCID